MEPVHRLRIERSLDKIEHGIEGIVAWKAAAEVRLVKLEEEVGRLREVQRTLEDRTARSAWIPILVTALLTSALSAGLVQFLTR